MKRSAAPANIRRRPVTHPTCGRKQRLRGWGNGTTEFRWCPYLVTPAPGFPETLVSKPSHPLLLQRPASPSHRMAWWWYRWCSQRRVRSHPRSIAPPLGGIAPSRLPLGRRCGWCEPRTVLRGARRCEAGASAVRAGANGANWRRWECSANWTSFRCCGARMLVTLMPVAGP